MLIINDDISAWSFPYPFVYSINTITIYVLNSGTMIRQFWQARHWPPHLLVTLAQAHLRLRVQVDGLVHAVCLLLGWLLCRWDIRRHHGTAQLSDRSSLAAFKNYKFFLIISRRKQAGAYFIRFILVNFLYVSAQVSRSVSS